jgi:hypothetical protein
MLLSCIFKELLTKNEFLVMAALICILHQLGGFGKVANIGFCIKGYHKYIS